MAYKNQQNRKGHYAFLRSGRTCDRRSGNETPKCVLHDDVMRNFDIKS